MSKEQTTEALDVQGRRLSVGDPLYYVWGNALHKGVLITSNRESFMIRNIATGKMESIPRRLGGNNHLIKV